MRRGVWTALPMEFCRTDTRQGSRWHSPWVLQDRMRGGVCNHSVQHLVGQGKAFMTICFGQHVKEGASVSLSLTITLPPVNFSWVVSHSECPFTLLLTSFLEASAGPGLCLNHDTEVATNISDAQSWVLITAHQTPPELDIFFWFLPYL